ncbi:VOC family protein [Sphingomonas sp.]|jgi:catechol 2,3-dioxygenase-like lactoylglutathione lyase family enzyme|uniref:VOC family protein n=1 Tax=Sphingomonas sp. TaxID=28214 RepID=UPI002E13FD93|nr:VOC family protein [Sphingomonas sp.]
MIDHMGVAVADAGRSKAFYEAALKPLGMKCLTEVPADESGSGGAAYGFGVEGGGEFWVGDNEAVGEGTHVAFRAETRAQVDAFYEAAIGAGGRDHGAPGLRPNYGPNYYAAFVFDPDGINLEAVCYAEE